MKDAMRKTARQIMRNYKPEDSIAADSAIVRHILNMRDYKDADSIFCFAGTQTEINTRPLLLRALADGKITAVPRCTGPGVMRAYQITDLAQLAPGKYGILEPGDDCPIIEPQCIDFAVIPCLACDRRGGRLGQGGGYYDRFLENAGFITAAACREACIIEDVPMEAWDRRMDYVVSEACVYIGGQKTR